VRCPPTAHGLERYDLELLAGIKPPRPPAPARIGGAWDPTNRPRRPGFCVEQPKYAEGWEPPACTRPGLGRGQNDSNHLGILRKRRVMTPSDASSLRTRAGQAGQAPNVRRGPYDPLAPVPLTVSTRGSTPLVPASPSGRGRTRWGCRRVRRRPSSPWPPGTGSPCP